MFGSSTGSTTLAKEDTTATHSPSKPNPGLGSISDGLPIKSADGSSNEAVAKSNGDSTEGIIGGKRRSSGFAKVLKHLSGSPNNSAPDNSPVSQSTTLQKLGKTDPALSVPQGSLNNSAGESRPGPRSTFRVGVTEDKNKKCRRTMEDTHAYLYNFLSTPAPSLGLDGELTGGLGVKDDGDQAHSSHVVETDNGYFAVFDGHAGTFAADWCGKKLHVLLEEMIRKYPNTPVPELLDQTFTTVDQQLEKLPVKNSGCTAITAVLRWEDRIPNAQSTTGSSAIAPAAAAAVKAASESAASSHTADGSPKSSLHGKPAVSTTNASSVVPKLQDSATRQRVLYTANVGDARIVLCRNGKALRLSYDHKGSDENEGKRISNAGGLILNNRVNGVLAVTRALGDAYIKDLVTGHPYTTETVIQPDIDEFLILACDGVSPHILGEFGCLTFEFSCGMFAPTRKPLI